MNQFDLLSSWLPTSGRLVLQPGKQKTPPQRGFLKCRRRNSHPRHAGYDDGEEGSAEAE